MRLLLTLLAVSGTLFCHVESMSGQFENRLTVESLKGKIDRREPILILDARSGNAYLGSQIQIPGSRHVTAERLEVVLDQLPRGREIIIYCA